MARAPIGRDVTLPVGGRRHTRWAIALLLLVDGSVFLSFLYAHLHVAMALSVCPPPGAALPSLRAAVAALAAWALAAAAVEAGAWLLRQGAGRRLQQAAVAAAVLLACAAFAIGLAGHTGAGLAPRADAWRATVAVLLTYEGLHAVVLLTVGGFVLARSAAGWLSVQHQAPLATLRALLHAGALQALIATTVVRGLPGWLG